MALDTNNVKQFVSISAVVAGSMVAFCMAGETEQSFPDGVSVRIESVQIGGPFSHAAEAQVKNPVHPDGLVSLWRPFDNFSFTPKPDDRSLYVWFRISSIYEFWDALLVDEDGQIERKFCFDAIGGRVSSASKIVGFRFSSYPRSQKSMQLRLVRGGEWQKQGRKPDELEFVILNPSPVSSPVPPPPPSCLSGEIDGTLITLAGLDTGIEKPDPNGGNRTTSRIRFTASDTDNPSRIWGLRMLDLADSLGNSLDDYRVSNVARFPDSGQLELWLHSPLWLSGNRWTLTAEFVRLDELPASQKARVTDLPVDPVERGTKHKKKRHFEIRAEEFPDAPVLATYYTACDQPGKILRLALELDKVPEGLHCGILEVKDDTGKVTRRVFGLNNIKVDPLEKWEAPRYLIDIPGASKTVEMTFGIQKIQRLIFRSDAVMSNDPFPSRPRP